MLQICANATFILPLLICLTAPPALALTLRPLHHSSRLFSGFPQPVFHVGIGVGVEAVDACTGALGVRSFTKCVQVPEPY